MSLLTVQLGEEHAKLMPHVDELRIVADYAPEIPESSLRSRVRREYEFLVQEVLASRHSGVTSPLGRNREGGVHVL